MTIALKGWLFDDAGAVQASKTVEAFVSGTTTAATTSTTDAGGAWEFGSMDSDRVWDIRLTSGNQKRWQRGGAKPQFAEVSVTGKIQVGDGAVGAPSVTFWNDPDSGLYRIGANNLGIAVNGAKVLDVATTGLGVTGILSATGVIKAPDGAVDAPAITFTDDTDCGLYRIGANNIGVAVNGAKVLDVGTAGLGITGVAKLGNGTVSLPAYSFTDDPDSGIYRIGANNLGIAVGGAKVVDVATTGVTVTGIIQATGKAYVGGTYADPGANNLTVQNQIGVAGAPSYALHITGGGQTSTHGTSYAGIYVNPNATQAQISVESNRGCEAGIMIHSSDIAYIGSWSNHDLVLRTNNTDRGRFYTSGGLYVGSSPSDPGANNLTVQSKLFVNETANANMTTGLTINQGAADNEILALKSSDVAHGMTDYTETDTYCWIRKYSATEGGCSITGMRATGSRSLSFNGFGTADNTAKTTAADAYVYINTGKKSGTAVAACGADANLLVIGNASTARFIFDAEGSAHADVEWTAYDSYDDLALLDSLESHLVKREFGEFLRYNRDALQRAGIVNFYDTGPRAMVNFTRLSMLHTGAIRQLGRKLDDMAGRLAITEQRMALIGGHSGI